MNIIIYKSDCKRICITLIFLFLFASLRLYPHQHEENTYHLFVSTNGSDENSGKIDEPFETLNKARDQIRQLQAQGYKNNITVNIRGGVYSFRETLLLEGADSAPSGKTITWQGYNKERAVISSGVRVSNWEKCKAEIMGLPENARNKLWVARLPENINAPLSFYCGNKRLPRARTSSFAPNTDFHPKDNPHGNLDKSTLFFPENTVKNWVNLQDPELFILPSFPWWMNILNFESVNEDEGIAKTTIPGTDYLAPMVSYAKHAFPKNAWLENVPEGMMRPGNWMVNSIERKIYYWPASNKPEEDLYIPTLRELIRVEGKNDFKGDSDKPVYGLVFRNLEFTIADRGVWNSKDAGIQHDWEMLDKDNAMLRFRGSENCLVEKCKFYNAGGNAIRLDLYAQHIRIENNLFHDLGQSAIMMIGYGPGKKDVNKHNRIFNNHIYDCGQIYLHSQMITAFQSGHNYIGHNYIHHVPRKAICITGLRDHFLKDGERERRECVDTIRWEEIGDAITHEELLPFLHSRHNVVEYNKVHNVLEKLGDGAAINLSGCGIGNIVRYNFVYDIENPHVTGGIRMDEDQTGTLIEKNILLNLNVAGITPKQENLIRNNFIIQACKAHNAGYIRSLGRYGLSSIQKNIFLNTNKDRSFYSRSVLDNYTVDDFKNGKIDHNLYFCEGTVYEDWPDLMELRMLGADKYSLFSDPLFINWEKGNFGFDSESPALKLGIEPIDISPAGLTEAFPFMVTRMDK